MQVFTVVILGDIPAFIRDLKEGKKKQEEQNNWVWEVIKTKKKGKSVEAMSKER